ncbi:energy transducer TonB [Inmirania thermothiophila]|uniref:Protein TonB n=1 Tax=Inmirania thermothiophila TaxID=1750597 RepID=A0A3N1Y5U3_9GAMM|nr:energy transducer TonB [Inmirania thermothiophila]ROR34179.1 protein TonB [Inmirania thermothiophila]
MNARRHTPPVRPEDRLGLMVFLAAALHAVVILGVTFDREPPARRPPLERLEITLVHERSERPPEDAEYLAQAAQDGGGRAEARRRPRAPAATPLEVPRPGPAPQATPAEAPPPAPPQRPLMTVERAPDARPPAPRAQPEPAPQPDAARLLRQAREMAALAAEIGLTREAFARKPRQKFISARTREYKYAAYEEAWRRKVERIGNLNYPEEARRRGLTGSLMLDVALRPDGTVQEIRLLHSSGEPILDQAAERIVRLAAPFAPFPPEIRRETDILHIVRTWRFESDNRLRSDR